MAVDANLAARSDEYIFLKRSDINHFLRLLKHVISLPAKVKVLAPHKADSFRQSQREVKLSILESSKSLVTV